MYFYPKCPKCPKCGETNLEVCDSELNGTLFKAVICPHCQFVIYMYPSLSVMYLLFHLTSTKSLRFNLLSISIHLLDS